MNQYEIQEVHIGAEVFYRFSVKREGGRTYYAPGLYPTKQQAESTAQERVTTGRYAHV